jgi:hypothetical protein
MFNRIGFAVLFSVALVGCKKEDNKAPPQPAATPAPPAPQKTGGPPALQRPPVSPEVATWPGYVVVTRGTLGFRTPDKKFYPLGVSADTFIKDFGPQDDGGPFAFLDYFGRGLKIQLNDKREASGYVFYMGGPLNKKHSPANLMTDGGIKAGATFGELVKAHGQPVQDEPAETMRWVQYPWGGVVFYDNVLESIHLGGSSVPRKVD